MKGNCPNCNTDLSIDSNVIITKESQIFKGRNVYCMCKECGYVMVYNPDRDLIFSLDRFKDDMEIIEEIHNLLNEANGGNLEVVTKHEEKSEPEENVCKGDCSSCSECKPQDTEVIMEGDLLIVEKETGMMSIIHQDSLDKINIEDYEFYQLNPVIVERIVSYKIQSM